MSVRSTDRFKPNLTAKNAKDRNLKRKETAKRLRKVESHPSDSLPRSKLKVTFSKTDGDSNTQNAQETEGDCRQS
jgi:hypothetical protein